MGNLNDTIAEKRRLYSEKQANDDKSAALIDIASAIRELTVEVKKLVAIGQKDDK